MPVEYIEKLKVISTCVDTQHSEYPEFLKNRGGKYVFLPTTQDNRFKAKWLRRLEKLQKEGFRHYVARAEFYHDAESALFVCREGDKVNLFNASIRGELAWDEVGLAQGRLETSQLPTGYVIDFWSDSPLSIIQTIWDKAGPDLRRITIKPGDEYDGEIDNS